MKSRGKVHTAGKRRFTTEYTERTEQERKSGHKENKEQTFQKQKSVHKGHKERNPKEHKGRTNIYWSATLKER
ncbi:MAG: hypothetical protein L0Y76_08855 [Ignavibacteria bacterium]|nr:hypothetical protein [Ignavibacteria bacterium]